MIVLLAAAPWWAGAQAATVDASPSRSAWVEHQEFSAVLPGESCADESSGDDEAALLQTALLLRGRSGPPQASELPDSDEAGLEELMRNLQGGRPKLEQDIDVPGEDVASFSAHYRQAPDGSLFQADVREPQQETHDLDLAMQGLARARVLEQQDLQGASDNDVEAVDAVGLGEDKALEVGAADSGAGIVFTAPAVSQDLAMQELGMQFDPFKSMPKEVKQAILIAGPFVFGIGSWILWMVLGLLIWMCCYPDEEENIVRGDPLYPESFVGPDPMEEFVSGHCNCCAEPDLCLCACCCLGIRWADTASLAGVFGIHTGLTLFFLCSFLNILLGTTCYIGFFTAGLLFYFRQLLRGRLLMEGEGGFCECPWVITDLLFSFLCPCCSVAQEARVLRYAYIRGTWGLAEGRAEKQARLY